MALGLLIAGIIIAAIGYIVERSFSGIISTIGKMVFIIGVILAIVGAILLALGLAGVALFALVRII